MPHLQPRLEDRPAAQRNGQIAVSVRGFVIVLLVSQLMAGCRGGGGVAQDRGQKAKAVARAADQPAGMCSEHGVPRPLCTKCNPGLIPVFKARGDWCGKHGFPKSFCPVCDPNAKFPQVEGAAVAAADWCTGHGLPESKCTKCNPSLIPKFKAAGDWCAGHGLPESVCPVCNPQKPPEGAEHAVIEARTIRFPSPSIEEAAGIRTVKARRSRGVPSIE